MQKLIDAVYPKINLECIDFSGSIFKDGVWQLKKLQHKSTALSFKISCSCSFYPYFIGQSNYVNKNSSKWCKYLNFN